MSTAPRPIDRLALAVGRPVTVALKYRGGKYIERTHNTMYTLTSGLVAFFKPHVAAQIDELGLAPEEPFTICLHGGDRYSVERGSQAQRQQPQRQPPAQAPAARPAPRYAEPGPLPQDYPPPSRPAPPSAHSYEQPAAPAPVNGQGEGFPEVFARCYAAAIELTLVQLEAARAKGLHILPTHEGLQAAAATLFIAETRR